MEALRGVPEIASVVNLDEILALRYADLAMKLWQDKKPAEAREKIRIALQLDPNKRGRRRLFLIGSYFMSAAQMLWLQRTLGRVKASLRLQL